MIFCYCSAVFGVLATCVHQGYLEEFQHQTVEPATRHSFLKNAKNQSMILERNPQICEP